MVQVRQHSWWQIFESSQLHEQAELQLEHLYNLRRRQWTQSMMIRSQTWAGMTPASKAWSLVKMAKFWWVCFNLIGSPVGLSSWADKWKVQVIAHVMSFHPNSTHCNQPLPRTQRSWQTYTLPQASARSSLGWQWSTWKSKIVHHLPPGRTASSLELRIC